MNTKKPGQHTIEDLVKMAHEVGATLKIELKPMRTHQEVIEEIKALKALKPAPGVHQRSVAERIKLAIEELEFGVDDTAEEWNEMTDNERDTVTEARRWKQADTDERPSTGWGALVVE